MNRALSIYLLLVLTWVGTPAFAQTPEKSAPKSKAEIDISHTKSREETASLILWNRDIVDFRTTVAGAEPKKRAQEAEKRVLSLPQFSRKWDFQALDVSLQGKPYRAIYVNELFMFALSPEDVDSIKGETFEQKIQTVRENLLEFLEARSKQSHWPLLLRGILYSFLATFLAILLFIILSRLSGRLVRFLNKKAQAVTGGLRVRGVDLRPQFYLVQKILLKLIVFFLILVLVNVWLTFVLEQFPYTKPWSDQLDQFLLSLLKNFLVGFLHAAPGMVTVLIIFLIARYIAKFIGGFFQSVQAGRIKIFWLHPETAGATNRLVMVLIWLFALVVAYPYIPGSDTDAFKGVSVFFGLMVSLGSAGFVNQVMSGLVVIYSRAFRKGDFVKIGESEGFITEVGMLSTKLMTRKREEVIIPNALLVGNQTINYTRLAEKNSVLLSTQVTIGYDTPWRQVEAMLLQAAGKVSDIEADPKPFVQQRSLGDFFVEYHLFVYIQKPENRWTILSELHAAIQDTFNEYGVQIMSPHFVAQPDKTVMVPKERWETPPAGKDQ